MGNARWTGVRLADVLRKAGVKSSALHLHVAGADRGAMPTVPGFVRSIPIAKALHPDTLLAYEMNGEPLPTHHGAPLRLVVPGWAGDNWLKWLTELKASTQEATGFYMEKAYRMPIDKVEPGTDAPRERKQPVTVMNVKSVLARPLEGERLSMGRHEIIGVAFSGEAFVTKVEVSTDDGASWRAAKLEGDRSPYAWRLFRHVWQPTSPGRYTILCRATDSKGASQPEQPVWNPSGYLHNAIDRITVEVA
jgi:hypothetical protein